MGSKSSSEANINSDQNNRLLRSAGLMSIMTSISRVLGLVRDVLMASIMGTSLHMDAYRVASIIPNVLRRLFGEGAMTAAFVPTFAEVEGLGDKEKLWKFVSTFFCTFSLVLLIISALGIILSPFIVDLFTADEFALDQEKFELTVALNRIVFPYIALISMSAVFMAVLNSLGSFAPSAFTPALFNIAIIVCGWSFASMFMSPAYGFIIGFLAGGLFQVLFQIPFLKKYGVHFSFRISFIDHHVLQVFRLMIPGLFAVGITQINILINTKILTRVGLGSLSGVYFANRLNEFTLGIFAISISTVILPLLSRQARANNIDGMKATLTYAIRVIAFIIIPAMVGLVLMRYPIISILFERGKFDANSIMLTAGPLIYFSMGLLMFSLIRVLVPAFYAQKKMKIPVAVGFVDMVVAVTAAFFLSKSMGNAGVALGITLGATVNVLLLFTVFIRKYGKLDFQQIFRSLAKILIAATVMGAFCLTALELTDLETMPNGLLKLVMTLAVIVVSAAIYSLVCYLLKSQEIKDFRNLLSKRTIS